MVLTATINTAEKKKSEQLFDAYLDFQKDDTIQQKNFINFQGYIKSKNLGFSQTQVGDIFEDLGKPDKKDEIMEKLEPKVSEVSEETVQKIGEKTEAHQEEMTQATQEATKEKTMKMEELTNLLKDQPENAEKNAETIVEQAKTRLQETIDRYISKIKELKTSNQADINSMGEVIDNLKMKLKEERNTYEKVKKDFLVKSNYKFENFTQEDLKKVPTKIIRYATREGKLFNTPKLTKMKTIRRNITIRTLIKKFNKIGDNAKNGGKDGVRFIMGFEKARFLRYTGIKVNSAIDKAGGAIGLQMNPQQFHQQFNAGRNAIFALLDAGTGDEKTQGEKDVITAIKNRINYYGATYARERANAWVAPFVDAEKNAGKEAKIIQINTETPLQKAA